jgi:hypothetical protein
MKAVMLAGETSGEGLAGGGGFPQNHRDMWSLSGRPGAVTHADKTSSQGDKCGHSTDAISYATRLAIKGQLAHEGERQWECHGRSTPQ